MIMFIIVIKVILSIILSYLISYSITMASFWIDLRINNPNKEQASYIKGKHLQMNKFVWLFSFIVLLLYMFL